MCRHAISNIRNQYTGFIGEGGGGGCIPRCSVRARHPRVQHPQTVYVMRFNTDQLYTLGFGEEAVRLYLEATGNKEGKQGPCLCGIAYGRTKRIGRKRGRFRKLVLDREDDKSVGILWISLILDFEINGHVNVYIAYYTMLPFILLLCEMWREYVWGDDDAFDLLFKRFFF